MSEITRLLRSYDKDSQQALNELYPIVHSELRKLAENQLKRSWAINTISTTVLVNETYLKLNNYDFKKIADKQHFFSVTAMAMRHIIINYAEQKQSQKRGGQWQKTNSVDKLEQNACDIDILLAVDGALKSLEEIDSALSKLVELRFFAGLTESEIAKTFNISERTVRRNWKKARVLLSHALSGE